MADNKPVYIGAAVVPAPVVKFADGGNTEYSPIFAINNQLLNGVQVPYFLVHIPSLGGCYFKKASECIIEPFAGGPPPAP